MDAATLSDLRTRLVDEREGHTAFLDIHGADPYGDTVKHLDVGNDGFADSGQATEERSEILSQIEQARTRVQQLDEAIERIDAGSYGVCSECGQPIAPARLEVRPLSVQCVDCAAGR